jgi:hypothetical protein
LHQAGKSRQTAQANRAFLYRTRSQIALFQKVETAICERGYYIVLLVLADNLHELGQHVAQHSFGQCAHLAVDDLSA